jgi:hypothetical protein
MYNKGDLVQNFHLQFCVFFFCDGPIYGAVHLEPTTVTEYKCTYTHFE